MNTTPFVGYLVMLANLQSNGPVKDVAIRTADCSTLTSEITSLHPEFPLDSFKETGFYRVGDIAIYVSTNVVNYITTGKSIPGDQGIVVTFYYENAPEKPTSTGLDDGTITIGNTAELEKEVKEMLGHLPAKTVRVKN